MRKKSFTFLLALVTSVGLSWAQGPWNSGDCTLTLSNGVMTVSGSGAMGDNTGTPEWGSTSSTTTSIVIGDGVTYVGAKSFGEYYYTMTLTLGNSVERIGNYAFSMCIGLTAVEFPSTLQTIGASAFNYCQGLTSLSFPAGLLGINDYAFSSCTGLTSVTCAATTPPTLGTNVFNNVNTANIPLYVPAGSVEAYQAADQWNAFDIQGYDPAPAPTPSGDKLPGVFSVSADKAVCFSKGNLQYTKSTGKWKIMDHQYDVVETLNQNVGTDYADQDVVTLFGWGTSGWDNTAADATSVHYQPYSTCNTNHSTANNNYQYGPSLANVAASESWSKEVAGNHPYENYDWGVFNSGDLGAGWRTLTKDEWGYLFNSRTPGNSVNGVSNARYTEATINTDGTAVNGIILFPDGYAGGTPAGVTWGTINAGSNWSTTCTTAGWAALEEAGCVFLPAAGSGNGTSVNDVGSRGHYWSSSASSAEFAYGLYFYSGNVNPQFNYYRYLGCLVRLVSETAPTDFAITANVDPQNAGVYYSTFYHGAADYTLPEGVEAYTAAISGDALNLTKVAEAGQTIPANNAVILKSNVQNYTLAVSALTSSTFDGNSLLGVNAATAAPSNCYVLSGHSSDNSVTGVGFYQYTGTLAAHKAYVVIGGGSMAPKRLRFVFNETNTATGMENVQNEVQSTKVLRDGQLIIIRNGVEYNANGQIIRN